MEDYTQYELSELYDILSQVEQSIELKEEEEKQQAQANKQRGHKMEDYITVNGTNLFEFNIKELEEIKDTVEKMIDSKYSEENDESEENNE